METSPQPQIMRLQAQARQLVAAGAWDQAVVVFEQLAVLSGDDINAHINHGNAHRHAGQLPAAVAVLARTYRRAPRHDRARAALVDCLRVMGDLDQAAAIQSEALVQTGTVAGWQDLGLLHLDRLAPSDAIAALDQGLALAPDEPTLLRDRGLAHLVAGRFNTGLRDYRARWRLPDWSPLRDTPPFPWLGDQLPANNAPILVVGEQGLGDMVLFSHALKTGAVANPIHLLVDQRLVGLMRQTHPWLRSVASKLADPAHAAVAGWMGLIDFAGLVATDTGHDWPARRPSLQLIQPPPDRPGRDRPLIGVSWLSLGPDVGPLKSLTPDALQSVLALEGADFISLQHGLDAAALARWDPHRRLQPAPVEVTQDIQGLAQILCGLDGIIGVSNSTIHLAGALNVPALLPVHRGQRQLWYWAHVDQQHRSRFYPSVEIWRPPLAGRWDGLATRAGTWLYARRHPAADLTARQNLPTKGRP